jgi:ADP-L-glycero-D-manno-heptose 6-epimerase
MAEAASPSSHSSFCEEVFSPRVRGTNEVNRTNILAPGFILLPAFTPEFFRELAQWEVVSSYSSATAPDSHGISCADPLFQARKELDREVAACAQGCKTYLINRATNLSVPSTDSHLNLIVTGGAGFIGSNLTLALQEKFPEAHLTVIDDFRSGNFKNLAGYCGDFVAQNLATLDWLEQFGDEKFDTIFHLASITDTTLHDQFVQVHDNVESFRRVLNFARPTKTRVIYASSASTYGAVTAASVESNGAAPANAYSFSKAIMDNIARRAAAESTDWIIIGLRYFKVYGPREAHKGVPASMVYHLAQQMKAGHRPRIFKHGEQKRDFVYVNDAVEGSIRALDAQTSGIYNLGTGQARSFNELVDVLNKSLGTNLQPDYIDNPHAHYQNFTQADLTNARSALGYEPRFPLEDGVRDYMQWLYPAAT